MDELKQNFIDVITEKLKNPNISAEEIQSLAAAFESLDRNTTMRELVNYTHGYGCFGKENNSNETYCLSKEERNPHE